MWVLTHVHVQICVKVNLCAAGPCNVLQSFAVFGSVSVLLMCCSVFQ